METETDLPNPAVAELDALNSKLAETAAMMLSTVPEHLRPLVPTGLPPADLLAWYYTADTIGVFKKPAVPATDAGSKPTIMPVAADPASLPAFARMSAGYKK